MHSLPVPGANDTDTTTSDVPEPNVEAAEVVTDDHEHSKRLLGVLDLGEEVGREAEAQRDLGGLVEVGLEDAPANSLPSERHRQGSGLVGKRTC